MSNKLPTSIDTTSNRAEYASGSGTRFLKTENQGEFHGVVINPGKITEASTSDGYPLIAHIMVGDGKGSDVTAGGENQFSIIDMRSLPVARTIKGHHYKEFRGELVAEDIPYVLVGKPSESEADKGRQTAYVGLMANGQYNHGRITNATSDLDKRRRFASNGYTSRNQFGIYVNDEGEISVFDAGSANGTSIEWGMSEEKTVEELDDSTIPRAKLLGGLSLESVQSSEQEAAVYGSVEEVMAAVESKYGEYAGAREFGRLTSVLTHESDIANDRLLANAGELVIDLNNLLPEHIDMMGLQSSLDMLRIASRNKDVTAARAEYAAVVSKVGSFVASRSRWFEEKYRNNSNDGYIVGLIASIPQKHFRRAVNASQTVNGTPTLAYLSDKLK